MGFCARLPTARWRLPQRSAPIATVRRTSGRTSTSLAGLLTVSKLAVCASGRPRRAVNLRAQEVNAQAPVEAAPAEEASSKDEAEVDYDAYFEAMNLQHSLPGCLEFNAGENDMPRLWLRHPASVMGLEMYLQGATITQWLRPDGKDILRMKQDATFDWESPIRSGLRLAFPQYRAGVLPDEDGFAARIAWDVVATGYEGLAMPDGLERDGPEWEERWLSSVAQAILERAKSEKAASTTEAAADGSAPAPPSDEDIASSLGEVDEWDGMAVMLEQLLAEGYDPAPFVTLRITDSAATREQGMWRHKFELTYKVTLMVSDEAPPPEADSLLKRTVDKGDNGPEMSDEDAGQAVQLRLQVRLKNLDEEGSEPMSFDIASIGTFATRNQLKYSDFIKLLGLRGSNTFDFTEDERYAVLGLADQDYLKLGGQRIDVTFIDAHCNSEVRFSSGEERSHVEFVHRSGFKDFIVFHPGAKIDAEATDSAGARYWVDLGVGKVAVPQRLEAGRTWESEVAVRFHPKYWDEPIFGDGPGPLPPVPLDEMTDEPATFGGPAEEGWGGDGDARDGSPDS